MLTFYYLNKEAVDSLYAQITPYVEESFERWVSGRAEGSGKLSSDGFLKWLGISLGSVEMTGEVGADMGRKIIQTLRHEQKLALVWKHLEANGQLMVLGSRRPAPAEVGTVVLFEGTFRLRRGTSDVARLEGETFDTPIVIAFSKAHMPPSIFSSLSYQTDGFPLSGCGTVINATEDEILIRPVALGTGFLAGR